jgi:hypothetical protein
MDLKTLLTLPLFALCFQPVNASIFKSIDDTTQKPRRIYTTIRLSTPKPVIDGVLNDSCWKTGEWAGNYTQWVPNEGAKPSQPTYIKILYDDKNIYVAIRACDNEPGKIVRKSSRRDDFPGDVVGINFDSYHDHRTGFEFDVTAAGQKADLLLTNPSSCDMNWNAVWFVKTGMEDSAWVAEFEIPLSQLRYSSDSVQVWGMHCWRWIDRFLEESDWEPQSSQGPGILYLFGELHGIKNLPKSRRIEIMPYALGRLKTMKTEEGNPFNKHGRNWMGNVGLDAKIGLSSNFTADVTINPDFGQVESDPSEMNLTVFETYYDEKRPFFLEGKNIYSFDFDDVNLFYSRRIGHAPTYSPTLQDNEFMKYPDNTSILSAVKLSGKTANGLSIGILQSLTAYEEATIDSLGVRKKTGVEPLTNYTIARVQKDFKQGNTIVGGIFTSTNRFIHDDYLKSLNREAYTGGLDFLHQWHDKEFYVESKLVGSLIKGDNSAIADLQQSSARYYQRPEADYISFDSSRTQLEGYGGYFKIGKGSKGLWRYSTELNWRSPGLDLNDIGYMQTSDILKQKATLYYFINKPALIFRTFNLTLTQTNKWNFGLEHTSSGANFAAYMEFLNKFSSYTSFDYTAKVLDTRILRGGPAMKLPNTWSNYSYIKTDPSRKFVFYVETNYAARANNSAKYYSLEPTISYLPISALKLSMSVFYSSNMDELQYVATTTANASQRYVLGKINNDTWGATFRIDCNITPELSIQYYGSPFTSTGKYSDFKVISNPKAESYNDRYSMLNPVLNGSTYEVSENNNAQVDYSFSNPDFSFSQFRSNLVLRWEYRPGSQVYLVWSQERTGYTSEYQSIKRTAEDLTDIFPNNVFLVKFSYWFSL